MNEYEAGLSRMICYALLQKEYDWDLIFRILLSCLNGHVISETFIREFWNVIPQTYYNKEYFSINFLREMNYE